MLPNNNFLVREIDTKKTQALHRKRLRKLTSRQPIPDIQIKRREWKSDPEVITKHDDLYTRSWECEYEKSNFDSDYSIPVTPRLLKITVQREVAAEETSTTPGTIREISLEIFLQADRSCDGTDTDHYMEPDAYTTVEQPNPTPTKPHSSKYDLRHTLRPNCNEV